MASTEPSYPKETMLTSSVDIPANIFAPDCPSRAVFSRIGDKWATLVIQALESGPRRFTEVRAAVSVVTPKVLTQTLRTLERDGLVTRTVYAEVPVRVEYELTDLGKSLLTPLRALRLWAEQHVGELQGAQERYDLAVEAALLG